MKRWYVAIGLGVAVLGGLSCGNKYCVVNGVATRCGEPTPTAEGQIAQPSSAAPGAAIAPAPWASVSAPSTPVGAGSIAPQPPASAAALPAGGVLRAENFTRLAGGLGGPVGLTLDGRYLYFATDLESVRHAEAADGTISQVSDGTLKRVPLDGGTVEVVATNLVSSSFAIAGSFLAYWELVGGCFAEGCVQELVVVQLNEGVPGAKTRLAESMGGALATDGGHLYWPTYMPDGSVPKGGRINRVPIAGGAVTKVSGSMYARGIGLSGSYVYWCNSMEPAIFRAPVRGGNPTRFASGCDPLLSTGTALYFTTDDTVHVASLDDGSEWPPIGRTEVFASRGDGVYWVGEDGAVYWRYLTGRDRVRLVDPGIKLTSLAIGHDGIFATTSDSVVRLRAQPADEDFVGD